MPLPDQIKRGAGLRVVTVACRFVTLFRDRNRNAKPLMLPYAGLRVFVAYPDARPGASGGSRLGFSYERQRQ